MEFGEVDSWQKSYYTHEPKNVWILSSISTHLKAKNMQSPWMDFLKYF